MATSNAKPNIIAAPTAKVLNLPSPIVFFKGRVNGKVEIPVCTEWVRQLETYFGAEGIDEDRLKITEAKRFIDPQLGDARNIITLPHLRALEKWDEFKASIIIQ